VGSQGPSGRDFEVICVFIIIISRTTICPSQVYPKFMSWFFIGYARKDFEVIQELKSSIYVSQFILHWFILSDVAKGLYNLSK
jgi:hypothetical protein